MAIEPEDQYVAGEDQVFASFRSANPRNNQRIEDTFLSVDRLGPDNGDWTTVYVDGDWCTKYYWKGGTVSLGVSFAEITWDIPPETEQGLYRICHYGTRKTLMGETGEAFLRVPDWVITNNSGSFVVSAILHTARLLRSATHFFERTMDSWGWSRYKDFSGCSKTFLVRGTNSSKISGSNGDINN